MKKTALSALACVCAFLATGCDGFWSTAHLVAIHAADVLGIFADLDELEIFNLPLIATNK